MVFLIQLRMLLVTAKTVHQPYALVHTAFFLNSGRTLKDSRVAFKRSLDFAERPSLGLSMMLNSQSMNFWVCSFHGSFWSRRGMLLGRRVRASCRVTLCNGLLPRKFDAGPAGPFSWCHGNQLALRPRRRGAAWSAHATTAVANISNKKSKASRGKRNKIRSYVLTIQRNTCSHMQLPWWCNVIFLFTQPFPLP